ncbi:hypothetical protein [Bartonella saheliensis]|uniref:hypothetical protein n=1 Tax=Bartonella saheliensis TaxID=1457016 RepID=UPI0011A21E9D|nr:hypothetical protein [Bartonella saheliensis]
MCCASFGGGVWAFAIVWNDVRGLGSEEFVNGGTSWDREGGAHIDVLMGKKRKQREGGENGMEERDWRRESVRRETSLRRRGALRVLVC